MSVQRGWPVFPAGPDKAPLTAHGFQDASCKNTIIGWWREHPDALLAIPTGDVSGLLILDIDPAGADWMARHCVELECGYIVSAARRGRHLYYLMPPGIEVACSARLAPGVDVRASGGYASHGSLTASRWSGTWTKSHRRRNGCSSSCRNEMQRQGQQNRGTLSRRLRNDHLTKLAGVLAGQGYDEPAILAALRAENAER